ncbi:MULTISPECIES: zinc-dependent alcohol dehydrogenase [Pseudofrankia]|uniref:zinc-dependent alcohol dehydrogenase n=1 Tax=Pseudofrankia TaxID=2994363 RepID=UPI000234B0F8|nr:MULTISPECIES: zinc-binding dehydrogenase [Pseudofrankia]OHV32242.1 alcohol dehydrogenase [Pseudofrankia sp. EUN1h]
MGRAIVFNGDGTWEERELPVPDPQPGGAVLRVEATGLCHGDVDQFHGVGRTPRGGAFPVIPGHEIVGRIEKIDRRTAEDWGVTEGDRVAVRTIIIKPDGGTRAYGIDFSVNEGSGLYGGYAEYLELLPGSAVYRLREDLPAAELTIFEALSSTVTWVRPVKEGHTVVVEGPGHMGLATVVAARAAGAGTIVVTGLTQDQSRLDCALRVGADHVIDVQKQNATERLADLTGGRMADVVIDASSGSSQTVNVAMDLVGRGGTIVVAGFKDNPVNGLDSNQFVFRQITMQGGAGLDAAHAVQLINDGKVPTAELAGETFPLDRFEDAFALLDRRVAGRDAVRVSLQLS